jgi:hypothetical protein
MDIDSLTIAQVREIAQMFPAMFGAAQTTAPAIDNKMVGKYVIVRCKDAGVHAGILEAYNGRECILNQSRWLWYWKAANGAAFLSGVATQGLHPSSKVGAPVRVHLTEDCQIIECSPAAAESIQGAAIYAP